MLERQQQMISEQWTELSELREEREKMETQLLKEISM